MKITQYSQYTYNHPSLIRRLTHKLRFKNTLNILKVKPDTKILDFGAGDGYLSLLLAERKCKDVTSYEPMNFQYDQLKYMLSDNREFKIINKIEEIDSQIFDVIYCLEVLEHLPNEELNKALESIRKLISNNGYVILSVPCESGFNGFLKNSVKKIVDKSTRYSFKGLWDIAYNKKKVKRIIEHEDTNPYIYEHFGFNNYIFENRLNDFNFKIISKKYFPITFFNFLSSQIFYVLKK